MERPITEEGYRPKPPETGGPHPNEAGVRAVAAFEAAKGLLVLLLGFGLLDLIHRDVVETAEHLLLDFHIGPDGRVGRAVLDASTKLNNSRLWALAATALTYAGVRFTEAWGLWNRREWAEWFAVLSGALYLPWEVFKVTQRANWVHLGVFAANVVVVLYMAQVLIRGRRFRAGEQ